MATVRVRQLLAAGAAVTVIAPRTSDEIERLAAKGSLQLIKREFERTDVNLDFLVVIGATNNASVQHELVEEAERHRLLYSIVDSLEHSNFCTPAVVERGDLKIAICTQGQSPVLAGRLRRELEEAIPATASELTGLAGHLREKLKLKIPGKLKRQRELLAEFIEKAAAE